MRNRLPIHIALLITVAGAAFLALSCAEDTKELAARVNKAGITVEDLDARIEIVKMQYYAQGRADAFESAADFRSQVLEDMITDQLLIDYAKKSGYSIDDESVTGEIASIKEQFGSTEEYEAALEAQGFTEEVLEREIRKGLTIERMLETTITSKIAVTDEEIAEFYSAHPEYFQTPESVTASHIIITVDPEDSDQAKEEAREKIEAIRQELVNGADFAAVAREKSQGPSAPSGGSLGTFTRGQMVAPFEEAAFALEPGELSDIVLTEFGYHVILVEEKLPAETMPIEEVSNQIREYLLSVATQEGTDKLIDDLRADAAIECFD